MTIVNMDDHKAYVCKCGSVKFNLLKSGGVECASCGETEGMRWEINKGGCCATCKYWRGDKKEARKLFVENKLSMDLFRGWANSGDCGIDYEWLETEINGDASVTHEVPANFGCVYHDT